MSFPYFIAKNPYRLTHEQQGLRCHGVLRAALNDYDVGRLQRDPWVALHLCLALSSLAYRLYPVAELYVERARIPTDQRPPRQIALPDRWPKLMQDLRDELDFPREL